MYFSHTLSRYRTTRIRVPSFFFTETRCTMKLVNKWCAVSFLTAFLAVAPALAQQNDLVNVNLTNVKTEIAKNINVNVSQIPVTVQAPITVAASVCGVGVDVLSSQAQQGAAKCDAKTTNDALNQIVQTQLNQQKAH